MLHLQVVVIHLELTVLYVDSSKAFLCIFFATYVSVNTKSMGLVGVECFLYINYILFNLWMMEEGQAVSEKKNMLFVKSVFDFFLLQDRIICCKIDLKYVLVEEVEIISFSR